MSDTDSNPDYPPCSQNVFDTHSVPIEYPEVNEHSTTPLGSLPPSPCPKTLVMAPGDCSSSRKNPEFTFSAHVNTTTPVNVKLDSIGKLTGQDNYQIWSASMNIVLKGIKAYEVVVNGVSRADDASVSNGSNPLERFRVRVGTGTEPWQRFLPHENPDRCHWASFTTKNPAFQPHNFGSN